MSFDTVLCVYLMWVVLTVCTRFCVYAHNHAWSYDARAVFQALALVVALMAMLSFLSAAVMTVLYLMQ